MKRTLRDTPMESSHATPKVEEWKSLLAEEFRHRYTATLNTSVASVSTVENPSDISSIHNTIASEEESIFDSFPLDKVERKSKPVSKVKISPLAGALSNKANEQILRMVLTRRGSSVVGWFDYVDDGFRQLMLLNRFTSSNNIHIYAQERPAMSSEVILIPGSIKDGDDGLIEYHFRSRGDAQSALAIFLEAFRELSNLVKGLEPEEKIGTKLDSSYIHIF